MGLAPDAAVAAHGALDVAAPEDALERGALRHCHAVRRLPDQRVHGVEAGRQLGDGVVVGPPLERGVRMMWDRGCGGAR